MLFPDRPFDNDDLPHPFALSLPVDTSTMPARDPSVASSPTATSHMSSAALRARRASHGSGQQHAPYPSIPEVALGGGGGEGSAVDEGEASTSAWSRHDADNPRADESAISFMSSDSGDVGGRRAAGELHAGGVGARR